MPPFASGSNCLPDILADFFVPTSIELLALPKDFLKVCNNARVVSSCELFRLCLSRGPSSYYISPNTRFKIKRASSRGKGWQSRFFIVDESEDWGFSVVWVVYTVDNALSFSLWVKLKPWKRYKHSSPSMLWSMRRLAQRKPPPLVALQVVERGEEATTNPKGLSYPKSKVSVRKEVDSEERDSAAEADLPIVKERTQMQDNG
ncbi:hypothetical protein BHE74_00032541 [Ensete ventricosum]|nr:hypothetical protein BHE74_00032541 [Ensete ventricosum]